MILQFGLDTQLQNLIHIVLRTHNGDIRNVLNTLDLKKLYIDYLKVIQKREVEYNEKPRIVIDAETSTSLLDLFNGKDDSSLDDMNQREVIINRGGEDLQPKKNILENALVNLSNLSKAHYDLFNTIITDIFLLPSNIARGGSSSDTIGVIWANPKADYPISDVVEFFIHELTHNCMFIDEHRYGHYNYNNILDESNWATSAILKRPRPIDKVLHSIVVSTEIVLFRENVTKHPDNPRVHPPTNILLKQLQDSLNSLNTLIEKKLNDEQAILLKDRALEILNKAKTVASSY